MPSEENQDNRNISAKTEALAFQHGIFHRQLVKTRMKDHAGCAKDAIVGIANRAGLGYGAIGAADQILMLTLDPEVRGVVGNVGKDRDKGPAGKDVGIAFAERTVEMGHEGNKHG